VETTYQWLEPKPYKRFTKQWGIKGRNMTVWNLVADVVVSEAPPEDVARRFRLPVEAVHEALDYYTTTWTTARTTIPGQAKYYPYAVVWLEKAREAYRLAGREPEWNAYLDQLLSQHARKSSLVPKLRRLR
jgi:uncharacterized protein (DUF433 family)